MNTNSISSQVLWIELAPTNNGYHFPRCELDIPFTFDNYEEALQDHNQDKAEHQAQIESGERDEDDEYEWELTPVHIKGDIMEILDPHNDFDVIQSFNWKAC